MEAQDVLDISRQAIYVLIKISLPIMIIALSVGLVISLIQALTQIQEMTLSFVPKIISIFFALVFFAPYMLENLQDFANFIFEKIRETGE